MSALTYRAAQPEDLPTVEALLTEASEWLASRSIDQWQWPPRRAKITASIERGECFLVYENGRPIATITVDSQADPEFWTEDDDPDAALYVHRMAITRAAAGRDIGAQLLDWAAKRAAESGKPLLRLDAWKTNPGLHRYYRSQGFELLRIVDLEHRQSGALFQRPT